LDPEPDPDAEQDSEPNLDAKPEVEPDLDAEPDPDAEPEVEPDPVPNLVPEPDPDLLLDSDQNNCSAKFFLEIFLLETGSFFALKRMILYFYKF
jgi:hypothetical protein